MTNRSINPPRIFLPGINIGEPGHSESTVHTPRTITIGWTAVLWIQIPNTLNLDPDPGLCYQFWKKKKLKIILEKNNFLKKRYIFFKSYNNKMSPKEMLVSWVSESWIYRYILNKSYTFCLYFILLYTGIYIVYPDPYPEYGSGSTKLLNMDPMRIRIHNTAEENVPFNVSNSGSYLSHLISTSPSTCIVKAPSSHLSRSKKKLSVFIVQHI